MQARLCLAVRSAAGPLARQPRVSGCRPAGLRSRRLLVCAAIDSQKVDSAPADAPLAGEQHLECYGTGMEVRPLPPVPPLLPVPQPAACAACFQLHLATGVGGGGGLVLLWPSLIAWCVQTGWPTCSSQSLC